MKSNIRVKRRLGLCCFVACWVGWRPWRPDAADVAERKNESEWRLNTAGLVDVKGAIRPKIRGSMCDVECSKKNNLTRSRRSPRDQVE